jgi:hypothetical protein
VPVGTGIRSALRLKCFWAKCRGVEKCSGDLRVSLNTCRCVVAGLLGSLTRDVAYAELCLGHCDGCSLEHERLVGVEVEVEVNGRSGGKHVLACERERGRINTGYVSISLGSVAESTHTVYMLHVNHYARREVAAPAVRKRGHRKKEK